ncbi:MAG: class I tRNA ligase family protein, partial [Gemmatimonadota bacterium]|nr:class I tRNA ligase family protein [Gemmatimonadota bacterium]
ACRPHFASRDDSPKCPDCGGPTRQDEDVLDTWFSSQLWPFSTLGWPDATADLKAFYPTDVLVTAPEILFFWVARMVMSGMYVTRPDRRGAFVPASPLAGHPDGVPPFHTVYLHGTARDAQHRRMSKSLGNGIDPLDVVQLYGADALRWTVVAGMGLGSDLLLDHENIEQSFSTGRNFATKLWNIGRFLLLQVGNAGVTPLGQLPRSSLGSADHWILHRLDAAITRAGAALGPPRPSNGAAWPAHERHLGLRLDEYAEAARAFVWTELADWYLEHAKTRLADGHPEREVARAVLVHAFDRALRLLHPVMPFVTEALWKRLPARGAGARRLAQATWPSAVGGWDANIAAPFDDARAAITAIREIRSEYAVPAGEVVRAAVVEGSAGAGAAAREAAFVTRMGRCELVDPAAIPGGAAARQVLANGSEVVVSLAGVVDLGREREKLSGELAALTKQLDALRGRLANEKFTSKAPPAVVDAERAKEREWSARAGQLTAKLASLAGP